MDMYSLFEELEKTVKEGGPESARLSFSGKFEIYLKDLIQRTLFEEKLKEFSQTQEINIANSLNLSWSDVVRLIDALSSPPSPITLETSGSALEARAWLQAYNEWFDITRIQALKVLNPEAEADVVIDVE